jgi:serine/threonine protein kinase
MLPENVYMGEDNNCKLSNFGSATLNDLVNYPMNYRAPEVLDPDMGYPVTAAADVWSLGCFIYYLLFGEHAFSDIHRQE